MKRRPNHRRLYYSSDRDPGIRRSRKGKVFVYTMNGKRMRHPKTMRRIAALAIPPAWNKVWICPDEFGHIQATGRDLRGLKQYRYHADWSARRSRDKFSKMLAFGKVLPKLRRRVATDLAKKGLGVRRVLATVIRLMEETYIRVGNAEYEQMNGSFGITTLKDHHVAVRREALRFRFRGKSGVFHTIDVKSRRLANIVKQCRDVPGKELFQYYDRNGSPRPIDSGLLNAYLRSAMGSEFTAKDLRTWSGSLYALSVMRKMHPVETKMPLSAWVQEVGRMLGNSTAVCKKYYIHPGLMRLYEEDKLEPYLKLIPIRGRSKSLSQEEKLLMKILEDAPAG